MSSKRLTLADPIRHQGDQVLSTQDLSYEEIVIHTNYVAKMTPESVESIFKRIGQSRELKRLEILSYSRFDAERIPLHCLSSANLSTSLKCIHLCDFQVTASSRTFIVELGSFLLSSPSLEDVKLSNFFANDHSNEKDDILDSLFLSFAQLPSLKKLELSGCGSHALSGSQLRLVSAPALEALMTKESLLKLDLSFLEFEDCHFEIIAKAVARHQFLSHLSLNYQRLGLRGFTELMRAMQQNESVLHLSLRSLSEIGEQGFAEAMTMLQHNYVVENFFVSASPSEQAQIQVFLTLNAAGRKLLRNPLASVDDWIPVLSKVTYNIDATRYLLREVPVLCSAPIGSDNAGFA